MSVKLLTEQCLELLSLKGGCTDSSESTLVKIPHYWKSHAMAHISVCFQIDLQTFLTLTDNDLRELGISTFGARRKMLLAIAGNTGPEVMKLSFSTQLSTKFQLLSKTKISKSKEVSCFKSLRCGIYHVNKC